MLSSQRVLTRHGYATPFSAAVMPGPFSPSLRASSSRQLHGVRAEATADALTYVKKVNIQQTASMNSSHTATVGWPRTFNDSYSLIRIAGQGSFATVFVGRSMHTQELVAVKQLPKVHVNGAAHAVERISHEHDVFKRLQACSFVARLHGAYEDDKHAYIVQELCHGGDLKTLLDEHGPLSEYETACVMHAVLSFLHECHSMHVAYNDVKPQNFMLRQPHIRTKDSLASIDGDVAALGDCLHQQVCAIDFGCSQIVTAKGRLCARTGTPLFMAPELYSGNYGTAVDVWAAGVMMYLLLSGRYPFWDRDRASLSQLAPYSIMCAVMSNPIVLHGQQWAGVSSGAQDLIMAMLERDVRERISAADALAHPWLKRMMSTGAQQSWDEGQAGLLCPVRGSASFVF